MGVSDSNAAPGHEGAGQPAFFSRQITEARRFYLQLDPPRSKRMIVVCGGYEHCAADYHIQRTDFPYNSIEFVAGGEGVLEMGGETHRLVTGAVFVYGPGIAHDIRSRVERPMDKYFVSFVGAEGLALLRAPAPRPGEIIQSSSPGDLLRIFEEVIAAGQRATPYRADICRTIVEYLLLRIAESAVPLGTIGTNAFETYQRCRHFIETHYRELADLGAIAAHAEVDPAYICRLFRRYDHQSPWQYVIRLKMHDAAQRLQSHEVSVSQVGYEMGFRDPFQFSRTFRRVFGMSPRRFVQLHRHHA